MDSRPEKWYTIGIDNNAFEETEIPKRSPEKKVTPFPILHIPGANQNNYENHKSFNLAVRPSKQDEVVFNGRVVNGRQINQAKLERNRLTRLWKLKFVRNKSSNHRTKTVAVLLALALLLCVAVLAVVLYLTVGGGLEETSEQPSSRPVFLPNKPIEILASRVVLGMFKLKNYEFTEELKNISSREFFYLAKDITIALDRLFKSSVLSFDYNNTEIISFRNGSLIVDCRIYLNRPYMKVAAKVGMAFINGLFNSHGKMLLDSRFDIDVFSIMFTATRAPSQRKRLHFYPEPGWSQWTPWTSCSSALDYGLERKCDPKMKQSRVRVCRRDGGHGQLMRDDEICEEKGGFPMEERLCECQAANQTTTRRKCVDCYMGEICISMHNEVMATCRHPIDETDPTGCGGLCLGHNKFCRVLAAGAYQCVQQPYCAEDEWKCKQGSCIAKNKVCNGHFDCSDRSDEADCSCPENHFQCRSNSSCIAQFKICDGHLDCFDGSDEENCPITHDCKSGEFACQNGKCIPDSRFCDHFVDCEDSTDEPKGCDIACEDIESRTTCANGRCISLDVKCNGNDDCGDNSDELNCAFNSLTTQRYIPANTTETISIHTTL